MHEKLFQNLGFSRNEMMVYLNLAELGKTTATIISKRSKLPRSTVYSILSGLIGRGVVSTDHQHSFTLYVANNINSIKRMVEKEKQSLMAEVAIKENSINELIDVVSPFFKSENFSIPKLQLFEGINNVESMLYDHCFEWQKSISYFDSTWWGYQDHAFVEQYRKWLDYYWDHLKEEERILLFSNKSKIEKKLKGQVPRRQIKLVPEKYNFSSTIWVLGDYVVTIMTRQKPHYAILMKDVVFAANQRAMFKLLWESRE